MAVSKKVLRKIRIYALLIYIALAMNVEDLKEWDSFDEMLKMIKKDLPKINNLIKPI